MKKKYAVAYMNYWDNDLQIKIVEASDWRSALEAAKPGYAQHLSSDDLEAAKEEAFNQDWLFDVKEIE